MNVFDYKRFLLKFALLIFILSQGWGQETLDDCKIELKADVLSFENSRILMEFQWNNGDVRGLRIMNRKTAHTWELLEGIGDNLWVPDSLKPLSADLKVFRVMDHVLYPDHLAGQITTRYKNFEVRRTFRLYPDVPALAMNLSLKKNPGVTCRQEQCFNERFHLPGRQWKIKSVEFFDRTDINNSLVHPRETFGFRRPVNLRGNVLIATDLTHDERLFIIKEAPLGESQLLYPGYDFQVTWGEISIMNLGALYPEVPENQWFRCYGYVLGPGGETDTETLFALRDYMKSIRKFADGSEEMIMMNTWGDRGQDGKISEAFALKEIQKGKELGITHLQLDDGWQQGLSKNSKSASGNLWDQWSREDWEPHQARFPSGLGPVMKAASDHGIQMGLWFHPSNADGYSTWEDDAEIIMDLFRDWGIRTVKIDGMELSDKNSDINMRNIFDSVTLRSDGEVIFNVDATAGKRGGYFYLNEYGNIFLENRYTDWGNYYPHWTLRNLWQLSEYVPPEKLQVEFLNNTRNPHMYDKGDPLRPEAVPFDYIFAVTMAGQPLAWFESSGLPEEAFRIRPLVEGYKNIMRDFHRGYIFPIGEMPDGSSWTGFQSITDPYSGYFLIYRENNQRDSCTFRTYLPEGQKLKLEKILGSGNHYSSTTGENGEILFILPTGFSFGLYRYEAESE